MTDDPFDYKYPIPFPGCYQAREGPQTDYDFYQNSDYIKVSELMGMLLDPYCGENEYIKMGKPEEWNELYNRLWELISRGLKSNALQALNYSPSKNTNQKVNFWTIELVPSCIKSWLDKNGIIKLIEDSGIDISDDFVELISILEQGTHGEKIIPNLRPHFKFGQELNWDDVSITLMSVDTIEIKIGNTKRKFHYSELGFSDKRKGDHPIWAWVILLLFIKRNGVIKGSTDDWTPDLAIKIKSFKKHMKNLFGIGKTPIPHYKKWNAYKVMFKTYDNTHTDLNDLLEKLNFSFK